MVNFFETLEMLANKGDPKLSGRDQAHRWTDGYPVLMSYFSVQSEEFNPSD